MRGRPEFALAIIIIIVSTILSFLKGTRSTFQLAALHLVQPSSSSVSKLYSIKWSVVWIWPRGQLSHFTSFLFSGKPCICQYNFSVCWDISMLTSAYFHQVVVVLGSWQGGVSFSPEVSKTAVGFHWQLFQRHMFSQGISFVISGVFLLEQHRRVGVFH